MSKTTLIAAASGLALATGAGASANILMSYSGQGGAIPDSVGGVPGVFTTNIMVSDSAPIKDVTVNLSGLNHTWAGDLRISLTHDDTGTSVDLANRVGRTGGAGFGDSSDYGGDYSFNDDFGGDLWAEAAAIGGASIIPSGDYFPTTLEGALSSLASFDGEDLNGSWTLEIEDNAGGDTGALGAWSIDFLAVPAPGAAALFGLAGLAATRRRR